MSRGFPQVIGQVSALSLVLLAGAPAGAAADWPNDAGVLNARDFGARGDGRTDDTAAITRALDATGGRSGAEVWHDRLVYLPRGTYVVSSPLAKRYADGAFASGFSLIGDGPGATVIRLAPRTPGYGDPRSPRPVIFTSSQDLDHAGGKDYRGKGEGNDAYENFVEDLSVSVGAGNPGAVGIDFLANNVGAVRDVLVRADDRGGVAGVSMRRAWPGPALLEHVGVTGFEIGIDVSHSEYGMTLSDVVLTGQKVAGLRNNGNLVSADRLRIDEADAPAIVNQSSGGLVVLVGGALRGKGASPVENNGVVVYRGVAAASPSQRNGWTDRAVWHDLPPFDPADLPPTPAPFFEPAARWVAVRVPPEHPPSFDAAPAIARALASGASTVYLPHDTYRVGRTIAVPASVRRIVGVKSTIRPLAPLATVFSIAAGREPLSVEHLAFDNTNGGHLTALATAGSRTVVLRDVLAVGVTVLDRGPGGGPAFLDDVCCGQFEITGGAPVVARQLDTEGAGVRVRNYGGRLTVLGLKTEQNCTAIATSDGGRTTVLGGLLYIVRKPAGATRPAFTTEGAAVAISVVDQVLQPGVGYETYLATDSRQAGAGDPPPRADRSAPILNRGAGHLVPFLQVGLP